jgi:DNA (cytosine-5)-methyltransferase 1
LRNVRPIAVDLFAGAGGMSLGFEQAGFDVAAAVEIDPVHCATHKFNFPKCVVIPQSVIGLTGAEIRLRGGIGSREVDCVFGGAPCQGFSLMGQRAFDDPRNKLVSEFVRIVCELNAKAFVFENVKGLTLGRHKEFLRELGEAFEVAGYSVCLPWKVLNSANYGVPQSRERLFLIGARDGIIVPDYPVPSSSLGAETKPRVGITRCPTVSDAIGDLPNADNFPELASQDNVKTAKFGRPSEYAAELRCMTDDAWHMSYKREWRPDILTSSARTEHSDISKRRFSETPQGKAEPISRFFKLSGDGVCNTLRAGTDGSRGAFTSPRPIHYKYARCITVREMARLHGFPDWFRFNVTKWHGARQIGNSVPPPLALAVARQIIGALAADPIAPGEVLRLGDEELLHFDLSGAAAYFGIEAPKQRRNQKSGKIKRKQTEIERERIALERTAIYG